MKSRFETVLQFKIELLGIRPPIWRRIQIPATYTFWDLHCAIQDAMGWTDTHLHEFAVRDPRTGRDVRIGMPDVETGRPVKTGWKQRVDRYFDKEGRTGRYEYDFGDGWEHRVALERILPRDPDRTYPACVAGKRACPPEDCGGVWGYKEIVNGQSEFQAEYAGYDPAEFECGAVVFDDPKRRLEWALENGDL